MTADPKSRFARSFLPWARRVRMRTTAHRALTGAAIGLVVGAAAAGALWKTRQGSWRPWMGAAGLIGAAAGVVVAGRRRWDDEEIALYLDARLGTGEAVATAVELRDEEDTGAAGGVVLSSASEALDRGDTKRVRPPVLAPLHALAPVGIALIVYASWLPLPPIPAKVGGLGVDNVTLAEVKGLERVAELGKLSARDDEQKKRLDKIAKDAAALREKLGQGMERREALAEIARLEDAVQAERMSLGDGESRRGLEAALQRLAQDPLTRDAAKALGDRDLVRFDEEMQKLANQRESADRDRAKKALEEAAEAARKNGAADVGKALDKERELFDKRGGRADQLKELKELEEALKDAQPDSAGADDDREPGPPTDDKDARRMAKSMSDALKKLTPEERKRLAEKLKKRLADSGTTMTPGQRDRMKDLSRKLSTPEGQKELEDELKKLANEDTEADEAERQKKLDDAERGLGEAQKGLGAPIPVPGAGGPPSSGGPPGNKNPDGNGSGSPGGKTDTGTGDHKGQSKDVKSEELRSRANAKVDGKAPTAGVTMGRTAGRAGETANVQGTGALGKAGPGEVNGVDQSEVPEEYREQVGRYFKP